MRCLNCGKQVPEGKEDEKCPKAKGTYRLPGDTKRYPQTGHEFSFAEFMRR